MQIYKSCKIPYFKNFVHLQSLQISMTASLQLQLLLLCSGNLYYVWLLQYKEDIPVMSLLKK